MTTFRVCLGVSAFAVLAACTGGGGPPPQGAWKCEGDMQGAKQTINTTYAADGKTSGDAHINTSQGGMALDIKLTFTGTWKLEGDQLTEQMTESKITEGTLNDQPIPDELKNAMVQGMGVPQTSTMKVENGVMTLSNAGASITCKK